LETTAIIGKEWKKT